MREIRQMPLWLILPFLLLARLQQENVKRLKKEPETVEVDGKSTEEGEK